MSNKKKLPEFFPTVAERALVLHDTLTGSDQPILVAVGQPYWLEPGQLAACPLAIHGACGRLPDLEGSDTFEVMMVAIGLLAQALEMMPQQLEVRWPDGSPYFVSESLFGPGPASVQ